MGTALAGHPVQNRSTWRNHERELLGAGVVADARRALTRPPGTASKAEFFQQRRKEKKVQEPHPLKDWALRNTGESFANLPDWPWQPRWRSG